MSLVWIDRAAVAAYTFGKGASVGSWASKRAAGASLIQALANAEGRRMIVSNYVGVLRNYVAFDGRATRAEFWWFQLAHIIVLIALAILAVIGASVMPILALPLVVYGFGTFLPGLALMVRRFHDGGYSGWMVLLGLIPPPIGGIVVLVFMVLPSERGDNKYGADPHGATVA